MHGSSARELYTKHWPSGRQNSRLPFFRQFSSSNCPDSTHPTPDCLAVMTITEYRRGTRNTANRQSSQGTRKVGNSSRMTRWANYEGEQGNEEQYKQ